MALFKFTKNILEHKKIDVHNFGKHSRNFTYIDDAIRAIDAIYRNNDKKFDIYNIASPKSVELKDYIKKIENCLGIKSIQNKLPLQKGDVEKVSANIFKLKKIYKTKKITNVDIGIKKFIDWYRKYYNV